MQKDCFGHDAGPTASQWPVGARWKRNLGATSIKPASLTVWPPAATIYSVLLLAVVRGPIREDCRGGG